MSCGNFVSLGCPISCGKFLFPSPYLPVPILDVPSPVVIPLPISLSASSHLGCPISCGKFLFPSPYRAVPALDVPSPSVNSSSRLLRCPISCGKIPLPVSLPASSHLLWQIPLPISLPATSHLGRPTSHGKSSSYLPVPVLEVPCHVVISSPLDVPSPAVNSSSHLPTCQFPP